MGWFYDTRCIHDAYVEREVKIGGGKRGGEVYIMPLWKERERARGGNHSLKELGGKREMASGWYINCIKWNRNS
jgi:hypothetical protein